MSDEKISSYKWSFSRKHFPITSLQNLDFPSLSIFKNSNFPILIFRHLRVFGFPRFSKSQSSKILLYKFRAKISSPICWHRSSRVPPYPRIEHTTLRIREYTLPPVPTDSCQLCQPLQYISRIRNASHKLFWQDFSNHTSSENNFEICTGPFEHPRSIGNIHSLL